MLLTNISIAAAIDERVKTMIPELSEIIDNGEYTNAEKLITQYILKTGDTILPEDRARLLWEKEKLKRIRLDYTLSAEDLQKALAKKIKDFKPGEFREWDESRMFDKRVIDGKTWYINPSVSNLFFRYRDIYPRAIEWKDLGKKAQDYLSLVTSITGEYATTKQPLLAQTTFILTLEIRTDTAGMKKNELLRCWLPIPLSIPRQINITILESTPTYKKQIATPEFACLYFEQPVTGDTAVFTVKTKYNSYAYYNPVNPEKVIPYEKTDPEYVSNIKTRTPHEEPSAELIELTKFITANETNPYLKAKMIYDWIAENIKYSFANEYSTLDNLSKYTYEHMYGDCGQIGMLFITLCKLSGIPARWQSGWTIIPGEEGMHDWTEIYIPPYGWLPVDPHRGSFEMHYGSFTLDPEQCRKVRDFFFGNIDQYRFVINNNHSYTLIPSKKHFRAEIVDFQRGELETVDTGFYFDKFKCTVKSENVSYAK